MLRFDCGTLRYGFARILNAVGVVACAALLAAGGTIFSGVIPGVVSDAWAQNPCAAPFVVRKITLQGRIDGESLNASITYSDINCDGLLDQDAEIISKSGSYTREGASYEIADIRGRSDPPDIATVANVSRAFRFNVWSFDVNRRVGDGTFPFVVSNRLQPVLTYTVTGAILHPHITRVSGRPVAGEPVIVAVQFRSQPGGGGDPVCVSGFDATDFEVRNVEVESVARPAGHLDNSKCPGGTAATYAVSLSPTIAVTPDNAGTVSVQVAAGTEANPKVRDAPNLNHNAASDPLAGADLLGELTPPRVISVARKRFIAADGGQPARLKDRGEPVFYPADNSALNVLWLVTFSEPVNQPPGAAFSIANAAGAVVARPLGAAASGPLEAWLVGAAVTPGQQVGTRLVLSLAANANITDAAGNRLIATDTNIGAGQHYRLVSSPPANRPPRFMLAGQPTDNTGLSVKEPAVAGSVAGAILQFGDRRGAEVDTVVVDPDVADPDIDDTLTFTLSGPDSALFAIDPDTGTVTWKPNGQLRTVPDFEDPQDEDEDNVYNFTVTVTDRVGASASHTVTLTITDNEADNPPTIASITRLTPTEENTNATRLTWRVTFSHPVQGVDNGDFAVTGPTGAELAVAAARNAVNAYDVTASGGNLGTYEGAVTLGLAEAGSDGQNIIRDNASAARLNPALPEGAQVTYTVTAPPTIASITRQTPREQEVDAVEGLRLTWRVTFSEGFSPSRATYQDATADFAVEGRPQVGVFSRLENVTVTVAAASGGGPGLDVTATGTGLSREFAETVKLVLTKAQNIADSGGTRLTGTAPQDGAIYRLRWPPPIIRSITRQTPSGKNVDAGDDVTLIWRVRYSSIFSLRAASLTDSTADFAVEGRPGGGSFALLENVTVTASNHDSSDRTFDVTATGAGLKGYIGTVQLVLTAGQNIRNSFNRRLSATLPSEGDNYQTYTLVTPISGPPAAPGKADPRCYLPSNAGKVGEAGWTGCEGMYIVADRAELLRGVRNGYKFTVGSTDYTFADSDYDIFTGQVTDMSLLFFVKIDFDENIGYWDTSRVTNMRGIFSQAHNFNQNISGWDTSNVTNMHAMFFDARDFNQDISYKPGSGAWNTARVTSMTAMFSGASNFNQDLSRWKVTNIRSTPEGFASGTPAGFTAARQPCWGTDGTTDTCAAPTIRSITRQDPTDADTSATELTWRMTFSHAVKNVDATDFTVTGPSGVTLAVAAARNAVNAYDVTASGGNLGTYEGAVTLGFAEAGSDGQNITRDNASAAPLNPAPPEGAQVTYNVTAPAPAVQRPQVTIKAPASIGAGNLGKFSVQFQFSRPVSADGIPADSAALVTWLDTNGAFTWADAPRQGTVDSAARKTNDDGNVTSITARVTPPQAFYQTGTFLTLNFAENLVGDALGDGQQGLLNQAAEPVTVAYAAAPLTVTIDAPETVSGNTPFEITVRFSRAIRSGNKTADPAALARTVRNLLKVNAAASFDPTFYRLTDQGRVNGYLTATAVVLRLRPNSVRRLAGVEISFPAGVTRSVDGQPNSASDGVAVAYGDLPVQPPGDLAITSITRQTPSSEFTNQDSLTWQVTFSKAVTGVDSADFTVTGGSLFATLGNVTLAVAEADGGNADNTDGAATVWRVTASGGNLAGYNGTVTLGFAGIQTITDTAASPNNLTNTTPTGKNETAYTLDNRRPWPTIDRLPGETGAVTAGQQFQVRVSFLRGPADDVTDPVTGFDSVSDDVTISGGEVTNITPVAGSGGARYLLSVTAKADATEVRITIPEGAATDRAGNLSRPRVIPGRTGVQALVVAVTPAVQPPVATQGPVVTLSGPTSVNSGDSFRITARFNPHKTNDLGLLDDSAALLNIENGSWLEEGAGLSSGSQSFLTIRPLEEGPVKITFNANQVQDAEGNFNTAPSNTLVVYYYTSPPEVTIAAPPTSASTPFPVTFTFSRRVQGFVVGDVSVIGGTLGALTEVSASDESHVFRGTVTPGAGFTQANPIQISVGANTVEDLAGNAILGPSDTRNTAATVTRSAPAPTITSITRQTPQQALTNADSLTWQVRFSAVVTGVEAADFQFVGADGTVLNDITVAVAEDERDNDSDGRAEVWRVTASGSGLDDYNGAVKPALKPDHGITDTASNALTNTTPTAVYETFVLDNTAPVIALGALTRQDNGTWTSVVTIEETGSGLADDTAFNSGDLVLTNATAAVQGTGLAYTVTLTPQADGNFGFGIKRGAVRDAAGNESNAVDAITATHDGTAPTVEITGFPAVAGPQLERFDVTFSFSERVFGFTQAALTGWTTNAAVTLADRGEVSGGYAYVATVSPTGGNIRMAIPDDAVKDGAGNALSAVSKSVAYDSGRPQLTITTSGIDGGTVRGPFTAVFTFSEAVGIGGNEPFTADDIKAVNGKASEFAASKAAPDRVFKALITPTRDGKVAKTEVKLTVAANVAEDAAGNGNTAAKPLTVAFIDENFVRQRTQRIIANFMSRRADQLTASDPDISERLTGGVQGTGRSGYGLTGDGSVNNNRLNFAVSLRQMLQAQVAERRAQQSALLGQDAKMLALAGSYDTPIDTMRFDIWAKGQWSRSDTDTTTHDLGLLYIGADYRWTNNIVVGLLAQLDWANEKDDAENFRTKGMGWMIGPYVAARLADSLVFDGRVAYGRSDNEVAPFASYEDQFKTTRWLAKGQLTGTVTAGNVSIQPQAGIIYYSEEQGAYTDHQGVAIGRQKIELGRFTFGPKLATTFTVPGGTTVAPYVSVKGIWDFKPAGKAALDDGLAPSGKNKVRARVEGGVSVDMPAGMRLRGEGFFDGIGDKSVNTYGGNLRLTIPLHDP